MTWVQVGLSQLDVAALYVLMGIGFVTIYRSTRVINFAQGTLGLISGYIFYSISSSLGWNFAINIVLALLFSFAMGVVTYWLLLERLIGLEPVFLLMLPIALDVILGALALIIWGPSTYFLPSPFHGAIQLPGSLSIGTPELAIVVATAAVVAAYGLAMRRSRAGLQMQAVAENPLLASYSGIRVRGVAAAAWGLGTMGSALAGIGYGILFGLSPGVGDAIGLVAFPAIVLGGIDSIPGVLIGGLILAELQGYSSVLLGGNVSDGIGYILLLGVLAIRPQGLLGSREATRL